MFVYYLAKTENFREYKFNEHCVQTSLLDKTIKVHHDGPFTTIKKSKTINQYIDVYNVEMTLNVKRKGYVYVPLDHFGNDVYSFDFFYSDTDFKTYYNTENNILFINVAKKMASEFIKVIKKDFKVQKLEIDIDKLINHFQLSGIWFKTEDDTNVNAASIHGNKVDQSPIFDQLKHNKISSINTNYPFNNEQYNISITRKGIIIILTPCSEEIRLMLLTDLINNHLQPHFKVS